MDVFMAMGHQKIDYDLDERILSETKETIKTENEVLDKIGDLLLSIAKNDDQRCSIEGLRAYRSIEDAMDEILQVFNPREKVDLDKKKASLKVFQTVATILNEHLKTLQK